MTNCPPKVAHCALAKPCGHSGNFRHLLSGSHIGDAICYSRQALHQADGCNVVSSRRVAHEPPRYNASASCRRTGPRFAASRSGSCVAWHQNGLGPHAETQWDNFGLCPTLKCRRDSRCDTVGSSYQC